MKQLGKEDIFHKNQITLLTAEIFIKWRQFGVVIEIF